jgi:predicted ATP-binding protein involved in virulence
MRIEQIEVTSLFGIFNHTIPLKLTDHITIIHGPNGLGKTVLLKMVDGIFNSRYSILRSIPFKKLRIMFEDGSVLETVKLQEQEKPKRRRPSEAFKLQFSFARSGDEKKFYSPSHFESFHGMPVAEALERMIPFLTRIESDVFRNMETGEIISVDEAVERYADHLPGPTPNNPEEAWFAEIKKRTPVHLIDTDRLAPITLRDKDIRAHRHQTEGRLAVTRHAQDIAKRIQAALAESAALSQSLDRTFPVRLVQQGPASQMTADEVRNKLSQLEEKRDQLKAVGLLDKAEDMQFQVPSQMDEHTKGVLSVYVQDVEKKLGVFDDLAARIKLFKELINGRFLYKKMAISKDDGFVFSSADGTVLSAANLSSGEQHELVLLYELLFRVRPNSLILIDEPELSLHVAWQEQFLKDLQSITGLTEFDVLIATHAPQVINDRWDLTVPLAGPQ